MVRSRIIHDNDFRICRPARPGGNSGQRVGGIFLREISIDVEVSVVNAISANGKTRLEGAEPTTQNANGKNLRTSPMIGP